jgi:hypothetical protein
MKRRRFKILILIVGVLLASYIGIFTTWWLRSPHRVDTQYGKTVHYVDFHMTPFRWRTLQLWTPAFLFMEHVCGYQEFSVAPAAEQSVYTYCK